MNRRTKSYTLVELLCLIGIVAVVAGTITTVVLSVIQTGKKLLMLCVLLPHALPISQSVSVEGICNRTLVVAT